MNKLPRAFSALALLVAAVGIVLQILGGAEYPVVPPGIVILIVAAAVVWFVPWRGAPLAAIIAALFLVVGMFAAGQAGRLIEVTTGPGHGWRHLCLSGATIRSHVSHAMTKLDLRSRAHLVIFAYETSLVAPGWETEPPG
jgi:hypothetical protein